MEIISLWQDLGNQPFIEAEGKDLLLDVDWFIFKKGATREEIWKWFDENYEKGIYSLLYEMED